MDDDIANGGTILELLKRLPNLHVLSIAPLLAEAIRRIHIGESVSSLFVGGV